MKILLIIFRDPTWEKQPRAYSDLIEKHNQCDLETCACPNGRQYTDDNLYKVLLCNYCASKGIHQKCLNANDDNSEYICNDCCIVNTLDKDEHLNLISENNTDVNSVPSNSFINNNIIDLDEISDSCTYIDMPKPICCKVKKSRVFVMEKFFSSLQ